MTQSFHQLFSKLRAYLVTCLFVFYLVNIFGFPHTHIINGVTIVHSHIHNPFHHQNRSGNHTSTQLTLISHLSHYEANTSSPASINLEINTLNSEHNLPVYSEKVPNWRLEFTILRAPPCV